MIALFGNPFDPAKLSRFFRCIEFVSGAPSDEFVFHCAPFSDSLCDLRGARFLHVLQYEKFDFDSDRHRADGVRYFLDSVRSGRS